MNRMYNDYFNRDLQAESVLGQFLDLYFYSNIQVQQLERIQDRERQFQGMDVVLNRNNQQYIIDEKGYLSRPTIQGTFVLELSYLNQFGTRTEGWLFDPNKETTHYLLCWADRDDINLNQLTIDNIHNVEAILVNRRMLQDYLWNQYELNRETTVATVNRLLEELRQRPIYLPNSNSKFMLSNTLREQPINIVMPKEEYLNSGSVEAWYSINRKGIKIHRVPN